MEEIYESLATKIDAFGKEKSDIFLAKLTLLLSKKFDIERRSCMRPSVPKYQEINTQVQHIFDQFKIHDQQTL